ncbi:hypothetical protein M9978_21735 [Sphingomonas sp. MG17]|uniref:CARDB domain-containing protein n=1 Tax=Sphingomonas tagetis TaxID=2949092 RepID=A0A9X2HT62_9SPHN|nr:hypothetical protein [Sphingomonas tagetis]MCP3733039.1 hypothetical protein [Sphingomonas tagetis]
MDGIVAHDQKAARIAPDGLLFRLGAKGSGSQPANIAVSITNNGTAASTTGITLLITSSLERSVHG